MKRQDESIIDANILIRYLTNDTPLQAHAIESLFKHAKNKSFVIPDVIIMEIVYVLLSLYRLPKAEIVEKITVLLTYEKFTMNAAFLQKVLTVYASHQISFVDAYILTLARHKKTTLYTFDKKLLVSFKDTTKQP
ncbi:MAG TPA: PIN domain-containing protein [Patescibacteria group bacterium]|nr:PIN domain-containing protein [Patescibacteria group bacterium]